MPEMTRSKLAQVGLFPTGGIQSTQTPAMECTSYLVDTFDQLPPINEESLADIDNDLFSGLYYGGVDTPTTRQLSQRVADLEKGKFAVLTPSGHSASRPAVTKSLQPDSRRASSRVRMSAGLTLRRSVAHKAPRLCGALGHSTRRAAW